MSQEDSLGSVLDRLKNADHGDAMSVGDVLKALQDRSLGVVIVALSLIVALPIVGAIPGVSITIAILLLIAIGQATLRGSGGGLWLPSFIRKREIEDEKFDRGVDKIRPYTDWLDRQLRPRLEVLTDNRAARIVIVLATVILSISLIPLAVVPWGVTAPALGLVALGLALMTRDGLMALVGYGFAAVTVWVALYAL
jgi:hypothetical protein